MGSYTKLRRQNFWFIGNVSIFGKRDFENIYTHLIRTILICTIHSTKEVDISDGMDMSLADLPSVFSSEHNSGGRSVAADAQQQAGNMKQALTGIEEIKSNLKKSSAGTGSGTISTTIKVDTTA